MEIALSRYSEVAALEAEVASLTDRLEIRKSVERAKGALMTTYGMTEPQAMDAMEANGIAGERRGSGSGTSRPTRRC